MNSSRTSKRYNVGEPIDRFHNGYDVTPSGCWIWRTIKNNGYGQFMIRGKNWNTHRWSYLTFVGPIPDGWEVDHLCVTRACVNPEHLEAVTLQENRRRRNERRTHCPKEHEYTEENTYWYRAKNGYRSRYCRTCRASASLRRSLRQVVDS